MRLDAPWFALPSRRMFARLRRGLKSRVKLLAIRIPVRPFDKLTAGETHPAVDG